MTLPDKDVNAFIDALRSDLPSAEDEARVRARLFAAGVVIGAGVAAPSTALGAAVTKGGLLPKLAALSWASKVGIGTAAVVVATSTVPLVSHFVEERAPDSRRGTPAAAARNVAPKRAPSPVAVGVDSNAVTAPEAEPVAPAAEPPKAAVASRQETAPRRSPEKAPRVAAAAGPAAPSPPREAGGASVGAFPLPEAERPAPVADTGLREETHLVERALAALKAGDRVSATNYLNEHARRFPNGHLVRERERALARIQDSTWH